MTHPCWLAREQRLTSRPRLPSGRRCHLYAATLSSARSIERLMVCSAEPEDPMDPRCWGPFQPVVLLGVRLGRSHRPR